MLVLTLFSTYITKETFSLSGSFPSLNCNILEQMEKFHISIKINIKLFIWWIYFEKISRSQENKSFPLSNKQIMTEIL